MNKKMVCRILFIDDGYSITRDRKTRKEVYERKVKGINLDIVISNEAALSKIQ